MARYPTADEYRQKPPEGIRRCDELLQKNPHDVQLLTTKLLLTCLSDPSKADGILDQLLVIQPPIRDIGDLCNIEEAITTQFDDVYPQPSTTGPQMSKLWDNAIKATPLLEQKFDLLSVRHANAVRDNRMVDYQQALIQWKAIFPKNRVVYMCHAIVTQMLSASKDDLQSRLALSLARKAVKEDFVHDVSLDCRVPGQIFALQNSKEDLLKIKDTKFKESKQVYQALRDLDPQQANGSVEESVSIEPEKMSSDEWLLAESIKLQKLFRTSIAFTTDRQVVDAFACNAIRLFAAAKAKLDLKRPRSIAEPCFIALSALVKAFALTNLSTYLLQAAYLAETLLSAYEHVHEARLILVYLYMRLGLGSLAMRHYDGLKIKEVQIDTVGHVLFASIAVTHPHKILIRGTGDFEPFEVAKRGMNTYRRYEDRLSTAEAEVLDNGQTGMVLDLHQLRDSLRQSLTRRMLLLEERRIARLGITSMKATDPVAPMPIGYWTTFTDTRDFEATFDYGINLEKVLYGNVQPKTWLLYALAADTIWCSAHNSMDKCVKDTKELIAELQQQTAQTPAGSEVMTDTAAVEHLVGNVSYRLLLLLRSLEEEESSDLAAAFASVHTALDRLQIDVLASDRGGTTEDLPAYFSYVHSLRLVHATCDHILKRTPKSDSAPVNLKERAQQLFDQLQQSGKGRVNTKAEQVKQHLTSYEGTGQALQHFEAKEFCDQVAESARLGWKSFLKISLT